jgi:hypothetical protein
LCLQCDAIKNDKIADKYKIENFPTLKVFLKGSDEALKFEGKPEKG